MMKLILKYRKQDSIARTVAYHSNTDMFAFFPKYNSAGNRFYKSASVCCYTALYA